ncbi:MAG: hypothetical protein ACUZ8H_15370 [Candidatus Anammoxibacter sp.]
MITRKIPGIKNLVLVLSLFCFVLSAFVSTAINNVSAQHIDVFNIDFDKKNKKKKKNKETGFIEVVEYTTYKIAVEKEKLEKNDFSVHDLELIEIPSEDLSKFAWHIFEVFTENDIDQTQTREAGNLKCIRSRKGTMYWLSDGKKHVNWGRWTFWKCTKDGED